MPDTSSTTSFRADISSLKAAMKAAQRAVATASAEFKAATAGLDAWSSSADGLEAKIKQLKATLEAQNRVLELQKQELAKTEAEYGKNSAAADRVRQAILKQEAAIKKTESSIRTYESSLEKIESSSSKLESTIDKQTSKLDELKEAYKSARLDGNTEDAEMYAAAIKDLSSRLKENKKAMSDLDKEADELDESLEDAGDAAEDASDGFTVMKGALANLVADGFRAAVRAAKEFAKEVFQVGSSFESSMSEVGAISGAQGEELDKLKDKAKEMGETTVFSATESADAMKYMAMAGWSADDMLGGLEGIMNLAAASGSDLATTSDIVTDALTAMGYQASDAGKLADVMAAASSNANTNVELMGATFQYAAPIIGALGMNMEDAAVAIGLMANAGIKGQKSGTALRSILTRLSAPPKEAAEEMEKLGLSLTDDEGKMKSLNEVMGDLRTAFSTLGETEQTEAAKHLAGAEAMSGLLAIVNAAPEDFDRLTAAVQESEGAAQQMAETMNDNVQGQLTLLKSNVEGKMIKVFESASPAIQSATKDISRSLDQINWDAVADGVGKAAKAFADFVRYCVENSETVEGVLIGIGTAIATAFVVTNVATFTAALGTLLPAVTALVSPVGLVAAAFGAVAIAMTKAKEKNDEYIQATYGLSSADQEVINNADALKKSYDDLNSSRQESADTVNAEYDYIDELKEEYNSLVQSNGRVKDGYAERADFIIGQLADAMGVEREQIEETIGKNGQLGESIDQLIQKKKAEAMISATQDEYTEAIHKRKEALDTYTQAQATYTQAQETYNQSVKESGAVFDEYMGMLTTAPSTADKFYWANQQVIEGQKTAKQAVEEAAQGLSDAETAYVGYSATIANWEALSQAAATGSSSAIDQALQNISNNFITAETGTAETLQRQVDNFSTQYENMKAAVESGTPGVTEAQVSAMADMVNAAQAELDKLPQQTGETAKKAGAEVASGISSSAGQVEKAAKSATSKGATAATKESKKYQNAGKSAAQAEGKGITSAQNQVTTAAGKVTTAGAEAAKKEASKMNAAGQYTSIQYATGVSSKSGEASSAGANVANSAKSGAGSVSATPQGENMGQGFVNGILAKVSAARSAGAQLAAAAQGGMKKQGGEGSPWKTTHLSGEFFVEGFVEGMASQEKNLVKYVKGLVKNVTDIMSKASLGMYSQAGSEAASAYSQGFQNKLNYFTSRLNYENNQKLKEFDAEVAKIQTASSNASAKLQTASNKKQKKIQAEIDKWTKAKNETKKKQAQNALKKEKEDVKKAIKESEKTYKSAVNKVNTMKSQYSTASQQFISELTTAMNQYQQQANALIENTINGISDKYQTKYDELINKQNNLIDKMKNAGSLFDISGAGVITVNDIKEQTRQITEYANKLQTIKSKVSAELFDEITTFDMKEGSAYLDQLLAMSAKDLSDYNKAYTEKLRVAQSAAEKLYKSDFSTLADTYAKELNTAFNGLPAQLEALGKQAMAGFVSGLKSNTDYMAKGIREYIDAMIKEVKNELKIKSPSRVMYELGAYTGEGFADGISSTARMVQNAMESIIGSASPLGFDMSGASAVTSPGNVTPIGSVTNNYNLVQNNSSPKPLTALETYQARRRQIALVKAFA